jgi:hypothetical protein
MSLGRARTTTRNIEILLASISGVSNQILATRYNLTVSRIDAILADERHKIAISPAPIYREIRQRQQFSLRLDKDGTVMD